VRLPSAPVDSGLTLDPAWAGERNAMPRFVVRSVARRGAAFAAVLSLVLLGGCAKDSVGPGQGKAVWIGQSISGRTFHARTMKAIEGVTVTFLAGLDKDALVPLGSAISSSSGSYSIVRANQTGTPGDFWWFASSDEGPVKVYLALRASKSGFESVEVRQEISRTPSTDAPTRLLDKYQIVMNAALPQITGGD
jgi:hypothetical protein